MPTSLPLGTGHDPVPHPDAPADPLAQLARNGIADPATDERVRVWLTRLLGGDTAESGQTGPRPGRART